MITEVKVKQCGDGKIKKEYLLPVPITRANVESMKSGGEVYVMDYLADPVFTIIHGSLFNVRGIIGRQKVEIWYMADEMETSERFILDLFENAVVP